MAINVYIKNYILKTITSVMCPLIAQYWEWVGISLERGGGRVFLSGACGVLELGANFS